MREGNQNGFKHGLSRTRSYNSWKKMMSRCYDPQNKDYIDYGGRGITVAAKWHDVRRFVADMGERQLGFSLERVNVNGNYQPRNCCWLPHKFQGKNRRPWVHSPAGRAAIAEAQSVRIRPAEENARRSAAMKRYRKATDVNPKRP